MDMPFQILKLEREDQSVKWNTGLTEMKTQFVLPEQLTK
jgi:hypothetical protein